MTTRTRRIIRSSIEFLVLAVALSGVLYGAANFEALRARFAHWWGERTNTLPANEDLIAGLGLGSDILPPDDRLVIPTIDVNAPIRFPESADEAALLAELAHGVAHVPGTALPGETGSSVITGHSSQLPFEQGQYPSIFALLDKLKDGDAIIVYRDGNKYVYRAREHRIVAPTETSALEAGDSTEARLILLSCWPIGTIAQRLLVYADLESGPQESSDSSDKKPPKDDSSTSEFQELPAVR